MKICKWALCRLPSFTFLLILLLTACGTQPAALPAGSAELARVSPQQEQQSLQSAEKLPAASGSTRVLWGEAPPCANQPLNTEAWMETPAGLANTRQAAQILNLEESPHMVGTVAEQYDLDALALNVASGRLKRSTRLNLPDLPNIETVGELIDQLQQNQAGENGSETLRLAAQQVTNGKNITQAVCASLYITQFNSQPVPVEWLSSGIQSLIPAQASGLDSDRGPVKDTGMVSPDGRLAAFTSLGYETGGPVYLLDLKSQQWTNLIEVVNAAIPTGQPQLPEDLTWDVIGWFPDSRRLMIGPSELTSVMVINLEGYTFRTYGFNGNGLGGSRTVQLAPDGSHFIYIGEDPDGGQALFAYDLLSKQVTPLLIKTPEEGLLNYPRFSPDGSAIAYLVQKGHPTTGVTYALNLLSLSDLAVRELVSEGLGQSVPTWSPNGQQIAFIKKETNGPDLVIPEQVAAPMQGNVWVISLSSAISTQVTFIDGWARSPAWDYDSKTLAFVTQDGEVGMVRVGQPGKIWLAAQTSSDSPLFTSVFFIP